MSSQYRLSEMPNRIREIVSVPVLQEKTVLQNGIIFPDYGYDGINKLYVNINQTAPFHNISEFDYLTPDKYEYSFTDDPDLNIIENSDVFQVPNIFKETNTENIIGIDYSILTEFTSKELLINVLEQPDLTISSKGSAVLSLNTSNRTITSNQGANSNCGLSVLIPKEVTKLVFDISSTGRTYQYNLCELYILVGGYTPSNEYNAYAGASVVYSAFIVNYNMSSRGINIQPKLSIYTTSQYTLNRQMVVIDTSDIDEDFYIGCHRCDNATQIYQILGYK